MFNMFNQKAHMKMLALLVIVLLTLTSLAGCATSAGSESADQPAKAFVSDYEPGQENHYGNTLNSGRLTFQGNWLYYYNSSTNQIMKKLKDTAGSGEVIYQFTGEVNFKNLQVVGDWVYFVADLETDNGEFYRILSDGSNLEKIVNVGDREFFVVDNSVYFVSYENLDASTQSSSILKRNMDTKEDTYVLSGPNVLPTPDCTIDICDISDKGIYFLAEEKHSLWHMNLDGSDAKKITDPGFTQVSNKNTTTKVDAPNIYTGIFVIEDKMFYNIGKPIWRGDSDTKTSANQYTMDLNTYAVAELPEIIKIENACGDFYVGTYENELSLFSKDNYSATKINNDNAFYICTDGKWIYYTTSDSVCRVLPDGTGWEELYEITD